MKIKILVTGASGFIGTNLLEDLITKGYEVLNIDFNSPKISERNNLWKKIDITNYNQFEQAILAFQPDYIVHLAARTDLDGKTLEDYSAAYRPEVGLSKILPAISGFALNDCVIDITGSVRQVTAVSEDKQTANLSDAIYTFPTGGGTGGVTEARVTVMIDATVGDINTILDNINGEVI